MKIGIFDSGIGGLSVLHEAYHRLPNENYIFYADVDHVPYGEKEKEEIIGFADHIVQFLIDQGAEALVIACNTATSVAADVLRQRYSIPILGMEPAVKPAVERSSEEDRVLVMATPVTIREKRLHELLKKVDTEHQCDLLPMPGFVRFAEKEIFDTPEVYDYIKERLDTLGHDLSQYSAVVLGCTHFNYFKPELRKFFGSDTSLIDGNSGTIKHLAKTVGLEMVNENQNEKTADQMTLAGMEQSDSKIYLKTISDVTNRIQTEYYMSGRKVEKEEDLLHLMRLHNRLEEVR